MNETIKKADMHYVGFIDTCMQMGMEKDAADRLYKESQGGLFGTAFGAINGGLRSARRLKPVVGAIGNVKPLRLTKAQIQGVKGLIGKAPSAARVAPQVVRPTLGQGLVNSGALYRAPAMPYSGFTVRLQNGQRLKLRGGRTGVIRTRAPATPAAGAPAARVPAARVPVAPAARVPATPAAGAPVTPAAGAPATAVQPPVKKAPPRILDELDKHFDLTKAKAPAAVQPSVKQLPPSIQDNWNKYDFDLTKAKAPAAIPSRPAFTADEINRARALRYGAEVDLEGARAAGAQLTPKQKLILDSVSDPAVKAELEANFYKNNELRNTFRVPGAVRLNLSEAVGGPERILKEQTAKLRRSLSRGAAGTAGAGNAAAGLESAADTVPAAGNYLPWLALGGGLGAGLVGYGLVSNRSAS